VQNLQPFLCGPGAGRSPAEHHELAGQQVVDVEQQSHEAKVPVGEAHHRTRTLASSELHGEEAEVLAGESGSLGEAAASSHAHAVSSPPPTAPPGVCASLLASLARPKERRRRAAEAEEVDAIVRGIHR